MKEQEDDADGGQESPAENLLINDASGDQLDPPSGHASADVYLDPVKAVAEWPFVDTSFDFLDGGEPRADTLSVYLTPRAEAFKGMASDQIDTTLHLYRTINDQITRPGVTFYAETNLVLKSGGEMARVALTAQQSAEVVQMVTAIVSYLEGAAPGARFVVLRGIKLPLTLTREEHDKLLPPLFEIAVRLGIRRDPDLILRPLNHGGQFVFPHAQDVSSIVAPAFRAQADDGKGPTAIEKFAGDFVRAFGELKLAERSGDDDTGSSGFGR